MAIDMPGARHRLPVMLTTANLWRARVGGPEVAWFTPRPTGLGRRAGTMVSRRLLTVVEKGRLVVRSERVGRSLRRLGRPSAVDGRRR